MEKDSSDLLQGNDRYEGFAIDVIKELSLLYGFDYKFVIQEDNNYGKPLNENKTVWSGMVGEILEGVRSFFPSS